jgi:DNA polymerase elongation subunit (family B)
LAYKVTANSLYGVTGASTSQLCLKFIAAATTATGRKNIMFAKNFVEKEYPGTEVVYGDTDSIFIKFPVGDLSGLDAIYKAIDLCEESAGRISQLLKRPHNLEFEKVICPMILCAKKKYVGFYYTGKSPKCTIKYMGIVLKRRDNAPIVKHVFGEAIEILLKENDVPKAISFIQEACKKILLGGYGIDKFIMSKTLKDSYKNPDGIAHKVLADRIGEREPGNKPMINDRIPFVYVEQETEIKGTRGTKKKKKVLQGDKIENPDYAVRNSMPIDYLHYITNQIMNPVCQVFDLVMKDSEKEIFGDIVKEEKKRREKKAMTKAGYQDIGKFFIKK